MTLLAVAVEDLADDRRCHGPTHQHTDRNQQDDENNGDSSEHQVRLAPPLGHRGF
jgi:hypothetical protein